MNESKLNRIQESFKAVYSPISKAIGDCLLTVKTKDIDATAVISAIIAVAIDIAANANKIAKSAGHSELIIDTEQIARFTAFTMTQTLPVSDEMRVALDAVAAVGHKKPTAPGSTNLN